MMISFGDLAKEYAYLKKTINRNILKVLSSGRFILGREVEEFEKAFAEYVGVSYCIGCASGTDAINLALRALDLPEHAQVITQVNTCVPTVSAIVNSGAKPCFCDICENSLMMDASDLEKRINKNTKAIIPVNLYGASADYDKLIHLSQRYSIPLIEDCAQSHGARFKGKKTGVFGIMGCFSFYPSKNLGCYGDAGAIVTSNARLYKKLIMLRNYGQKNRYEHAYHGLNSRLDELQAAILKTKLKFLYKWNERRRQIAKIYDVFLKGLNDVTHIKFEDGAESVFHLYVIRVKHRKKLQDYLTKKGITTLIHYPIPCHLQKAYRYLGYKKGDFPIAEKVATQILSIPLHPYLKDEEAEYIAKNIKVFYEK